MQSKQHLICSRNGDLSGSDRKYVVQAGTIRYAQRITWFFRITKVLFMNALFVASPTKPWRVLIVEDDALMRDFFANSVRACADLELLADVGSVAQAKQWLTDAVHAAQLDVLLTDLGLPDGSGLEVIALAMQVQPQCEALVISMFGDEENVLASIEAGASGYIHKDAAPNDVSQAILDLRAGASPISPMIARRVLAKYRAMARTAASAHSDNKENSAILVNAKVNTPSDAVQNASNAIECDDVRPLLSLREQEVLEFIARGFSYQEIAKLQTVSVYTVQTHIKHLYAKLAVHSRSEAVYEAQKLGLLSVPGK